jgi:hypothetical protein
MTDHNHQNISQQIDTPNITVIGVEKVDRDAVLSFTFSIASAVLSIFTFGILSILAIPGVILGHIALKNMQPNKNGRGFALAGLIIGYIMIGLASFALLLIILFLLIGNAIAPLNGS